MKYIPPFNDIRVFNMAESYGFELTITDPFLYFRRSITDDETEEINVILHGEVIPNDRVGPQYEIWFHRLARTLEQKAMEQDGVSLDNVIDLREPPGGHEEMNRIMKEALEQKRRQEEMMFYSPPMQPYHPLPVPNPYPEAPIRYWYGDRT